MADPVSLGAVGIGSTALGALTSAFGAKYSGDAQAAMYNYQAGVARVNATLAQQDANYATSAGEVEAQESGMKTASEVAATRAGFGASNIDVNTGSHAAVTGSETEIGQFEQQAIRANAAKTAFGFNVKAAQDTAQAGAYDTAATTSKTSGDISAVSSLISGFGSVSSKWLQAKQVGIGSGSGLNFSGPGSGDYSGVGGWV